MDIGILGAGNVGGTLGAGWAARGHRVKFGVAEPADPKTQDLLVKAGANASSASLADAAQFGEVVALTVPWNAVETVLAGAGDLTRKILLDCSNPNFAANPQGHEFQPSLSGGEQVAQWANGARVVKIFNTTGFENMANPDYGGAAVTMFYAGDDLEAKQVAAQLARDLEFDPVDAGPLANARMLESLAQLWGQLAYGQGRGRNIAFLLMSR